jgi:hypothetical protein
MLTFKQYFSEADERHPWHAHAVSAGLKYNAQMSTRASGGVSHTYVDPKSGKLVKLFKHRDRVHYAIKHGAKVKSGQSVKEFKEALREEFGWNESTTPNDYAPNDYSPHSAPGKGVFEGFSEPTEHPFHSVVAKHNYKHTDTSAMLGAKNHTFSNDKGHQVHLKTTSGGQHSWHSSGKSGDTSASLNGHLMFHRESINESAEKHSLHSTATSLGYEHGSTVKPGNGEPTEYHYGHTKHGNKAPRVVLLDKPGSEQGFRVHHPVKTKKSTSGSTPEQLKKAVAKYSIHEGLFSKKPVGQKPAAQANAGDSPHYKTNHSYNHSDIEPSTVPVFKPSWQTAGKSDATKKEDVKSPIAGSLPPVKGIPKLNFPTKHKAKAPKSILTEK